MYYDDHEDDCRDCLAAAMRKEAERRGMTLPPDYQEVIAHAETTAEATLCGYDFSGRYSWDNAHIEATDIFDEFVLDLFPVDINDADYGEMAELWVAISAAALSMCSRERRHQEEDGEEIQAAKEADTEAREKSKQAMRDAIMGYTRWISTDDDEDMLYGTGLEVVKDLARADHEALHEDEAEVFGEFSNKVLEQHGVKLPSFESLCAFFG